MRKHRSLHKLFSELETKIQGLAFSNWQMIEEMEKMGMDIDPVESVQVGLHKALSHISGASLFYYTKAFDSVENNPKILQFKKGG